MILAIAEEDANIVYYEVSHCPLPLFNHQTFVIDDCHQKVVNSQLSVEQENWVLSFRHGRQHQKWKINGQRLDYADYDYLIRLTKMD